MPRAEFGGNLMFSSFMLPGLFLGIGVSGVVWWGLEEFTRLEASKADGISVVSGLAVAFIMSIINRGLLRDPLQVGVAVVVLALSYLLVRFEQKRNIYTQKRNHSI